MPNTPNSEFNEIDLSHGVAEIPVAINAVQVKTKRGPIGKVALLITSWPQFQRIYGGQIPGEQGPTLAKRALERGSALRVNRSMHYTDVADPTTYDAEFAIASKSYRLTLAGALAAGHAIVATKGADVITQPFSTSSIETLRLFLVQLLAQTWIAGGTVIDATHLNVGASSATDIVFSVTGAGAPVLTTANATSVVDATGNILFSFVPKNPGEDGNNLAVDIQKGSNGRTDSFNVIIRHKLEDITEPFFNLKIPGKPTVANSKYLDKITKESEFISPVYFDLSAMGGVQLVPAFGQTLGFAGGTDGAALTAADYIGDAAGKTGFHAFDGVDDASAIAILDDIEDLNGIVEAGAAYAATRADVKYFHHIPGITEQAVVTARNAWNVDNSYIRFFAGNVRHINTLTGEEETISELGDVLGIFAYSEEKFGSHISAAGKRRGQVLNALGSGNNWGARGNKANLNMLAQAQVNVIIDRDRSTYLLGNFTGQVGLSQLSFGNVRDTLISIKKSLAPTVDRYQEEPCEPLTWKQLYLEVLPYLTNLEAIRALAPGTTRWEGDQFATGIAQEDLIINKASDVAVGKYKVRLFVTPIVSMQEIEIGIVITPSSVSFEDALNILQNS